MKIEEELLIVVNTIKKDLNDKFKGIVTRVVLSANKDYIDNSDFDISLLFFYKKNDKETNNTSWGKTIEECMNIIEKLIFLNINTK